VSSNVPVLIHLELRDVFQIVFFVSQREHCIFLEGSSSMFIKGGALSLSLRSNGHFIGEPGLAGVY